MAALDLWNRHRHHLSRVAPIRLTLDVSRMRFDDGFLGRMTMQQAVEAMDALEAGAIANPDEQRMAGYYWLRAPDLAPTPEIAAALSTTPQAPEQVAASTGVPESAETVYLLLEHQAANGRARTAGADDPGLTTFVRA
jgi:glucose-6-phosphate isomerase